MTGGRASVVLYTGNVCSTPFINAFKLVSGFCVPLHEHLDQHFIKWKIPEAEAGEIFCEALAAVLKREYTPILDRLGISSEDLLSPEHAEHLIFKWRPFNAEDAATAVAQKALFVEAQIQPFLIARRSLIEQCTKVIITERYYGNRWPQFKAAQMSSQQYEDYIAEQKTVMIELGDKDLETIAREARGFYIRTCRVLEMADRFFPGRNCKLIVSESLFKPHLDKTAFRTLCSEEFGCANTKLGNNIHIERSSRKAGLALSNVINPELVFESEDLMELEAQYCDLLRNKFNFEFQTFA